VFIPLGGSRANPIRTSWNAMVTFLLSGFWHGASWNFLVWGGINGLAVTPTIVRGESHRITRTDVPGGERDLPDLGTLARILATFAVTCLAWVFFRAKTFADALLVLQRIFTGLLDTAAIRVLMHEVAPQKKTYVALALFVLVEWIMRREEHPLRAVARWPLAARWAGYTVIVWGSLYLAPWVPGRFIYFQF
jgi:D-alanyl-lipoteichoic acid acyltransferase DltB (MBOAT superfamily)